MEFQGAGTCNPNMTMMEGRPEGLRIGLYCSLPRIFLCYYSFSLRNPSNISYYRSEMA